MFYFRDFFVPLQHISAENMRKVIYLLLLPLLMTACQLKATQAAEVGENAEEQSGDPKATIVFLTERTHDFGTYGARETVYFDFVFRNDGKVPFVIQKVEPSCGCLSVEYPKHPVPSGAIDTIHVGYDGNGFESGFFTKRCDVYSNADSVFYLRVQGTYSKTLEEQWLKEHPSSNVQDK